MVAVTAMLSAEPVMIGVCVTDQEGGLPCLSIPAGDTCQQCYKHWQEPLPSECVWTD